MKKLLAVLILAASATVGYGYNNDCGSCSSGGCGQYNNGCPGCPAPCQWTTGSGSYIPPSSCPQCQQGGANQQMMGQPQAGQPYQGGQYPQGQGYSQQNTQYMQGQYGQNPNQPNQPMQPNQNKTSGRSY